MIIPMRYNILWRSLHQLRLNSIMAKACPLSRDDAHLMHDTSTPVLLNGNQDVDASVALDYLEPILRVDVEQSGKRRCPTQ